MNAIETTLDPPTSQPLSQTNGKLDTNADIVDRLLLAEKRGDAWIWSTHHDSSGLDRTAFYLRCTNTAKDLFIVKIRCYTSSKTIFTLNTATGDGSGELTNETNLDLSLSTEADAVHLANNVDDLGDVDEIECSGIPAEGTTTFDLGGAMKLVNGGKAITILQAKSGNDTCVSCLGFFE